MKQSNAFDLAIEQTYQSLSKIVHTTIVDRWVLRRPPFLFLYKLLVEILAQHNVFTQEQLSITNLVDREDKAAFLVRALAFVEFVLADSKEFPFLLCISPIKVLAGVEVENTLIFLRQLCQAHSSVSHVAKMEALRKISDAGVAHLYTAGVVFRRGMLLLQALVRGFMHRRRLSQSAFLLSTNYSVEASENISTSFINSSLDNTSKLSVARGTKFWFESADGKIEAGTVVRKIHGMYELVFDEAARRTERVDSSKMRAILEASACLNDLMYQEEIDFPSGGGASCDKNHIQTSKEISDLLGDYLPPINESLLQKQISQGYDDPGQIIFNKRNTKSRPSRYDNQNGSKVLSEEKSKPLDNTSSASSWRLSKKSRSLSKVTSMPTITPDVSDANKALQLPGQDDPSNKALKATIALVKKTKADKMVSKKKALFNSEERRTNGLTEADTIGRRKQKQNHDKQKLFNGIARHIDTFIKHRQLHMADFFRLFDTDNSSGISSSELVNALAQMDLYLTAEQAQDFCAYVDHNGDGEIDIEELAEILRMARIDSSQLDQARKDASQSGGFISFEADQVIKKAKSSLPFLPLYKYRTRIYEAFAALERDDTNIVDATELYVALVQLEIPDCSESMLHDLVQWSLAMPMLIYENASLEQIRGCGKDRKLHIQQLSRVLEDGMKSKRSNPFLDMIWINQFDAQMERGYRAFQVL
uniref:Uncharacterized protein AlNc14C1G141 n=1 Tax=Albugo laibachii Nc14 TaxID=890382 RepID=F0VYZ4_9STRA|nr:conserved hypothetical protein [Albugo laibachii Nc14]|eukprot:CCA14009.1 conserved hypothetical protein [Albugo laibachii Nc14]